MIRPALALAAVAALAACQPATTPANAISEGGVPFGPYFLVGLGADPVPERNISLNLSPNAMTGRGPCNTYTATNTQQLPAVQISQMNWTDASCGAMEQRYFSALTRVTSAEFSGGLLLLKAPDIWLTYEAGTIGGE